jgi:hypothetical protein
MKLLSIIFVAIIIVHGVLIKLIHYKLVWISTGTHLI